MLIFEQGDILTGNYPIFCHQVNCQGDMGAGLAKQIKEKYPEVYEEYHADALEGGSDYLGAILPVTTKDGRICINMYAQDRYGKKGHFTNYDAFKECLDNIHDFLWVIRDPSRTVAFPYGIGCGLGGGDWNIIHGLLSNFAIDVKQDVVIVRRMPFNGNH